MQTILVVDDNESLRDSIGLMLEREKFVPVLTGDGISGFEKARTLRPQLILVDLRLPGMSGFEICKQLRAEGIQTPLIVLSAVRDEIDKVLLLEIGADDYIEKPFGTRELLARIRALLRRAAPAPKTFHFGEAEVDIDHRTTTCRGAEVKLTPAEYKLLLFFLHNPDRIVTRDQILNAVWGYEAYPNTRTIDAHVVRLRHKLEPQPNVPRHFITVHGVGYRFLH